MPKLMLRVDLQSTSLIAATFQSQSAFLELEFRSRAIYRYSHVPAQLYQELLRAESKGRYFNQHIRNRFSYTKIDPACNGQLAIPRSIREPSNPQVMDFD